MSLDAANVWYGFKVIVAFPFFFESPSILRFSKGLERVWPTARDRQKATGRIYRSSPFRMFRHPMSRIIVMQRPSSQIFQLLQGAVLELQQSPDLTEEEVRWLQQYAMHLISEFIVLKETGVGVAVPLEGEPAQ